MEFEVVHRLPGSAEAVFRVLQSPAFREEAAAKTGTERTLLSEEVRSDGARFERWKMVDRNKKRPAFVTRFIGPVLQYEFEQTTWFDRRAVSWRVIPALGPDKVKAEGEETIEEDEGSVVRRVKGVVEVKVPVFGPRLANYIGSEVEAGFRRALPFVESYVKRALKSSL